MLFWTDRPVGWIFSHRVLFHPEYFLKIKSEQVLLLQLVQVTLQRQDEK
jgi:hypothetical protein